MFIDRSWICLFIGFLCAANIAALGSAQEVKAPQSEDSKSDQAADANMGKLYWIFLTTGKSTDGVEPDEIAAMQKAHLDNFKRLAGEGKLLTAGPMSDPDEKLRGIVVVKSKNPDELTKLFLDDPYIAEGYLRIEATEMKIQHGVINTNIAPQGLEEFRLVVFERDANVAKMDETQQLENRKVLSSLSAEKEIRLAVDLAEAKFNRAGLIIVTKPENDQSLANRLKEIPAVKSGNWKSRTFNLYMGKGTLANAG